MDFAFFESLSDAEATAFLERYLEVEAKEIEESLRLAADASVVADYSLASVQPFFSWLLKSVKTVPTEPDETLPAWIRENPDYVSGLFDFEEDSTPLVLRASYYLGVAFVRSFPSLTWATGSPDTAVYHQPVVSGFQTGTEMAPLLIAENLFLRVLEDESRVSDIDRAVNTWAQSV